MKFSVLLAAAWVLSATALAQQAETSDEEADERRMEAVRVLGSDPVYGEALTAFQMGDYERAEIEFQDIFNDLRRNINIRENAYTLGVLASENSATLPAAPAGATSLGRDASAIGVQVGADIGNSYARTKGKGARRSRMAEMDRDDLALPLYMAGLSQIQLGKYAEAKESLYRSLAYERRNDDARFRIGLLELRDGRVDKAEDQAKILRKRVKKCRPDCVDEDGNDLAANLDILELGIEQLKSGELVME